MAITDAPHAHEDWNNAGRFEHRMMPLRRTDFSKRSITVGVGGPVGSGKTALLLQLCRRLRDTVNLAVVTNDIFTREDGEFLVRNEALSADRISAVRNRRLPARGHP